MKIWDSDNAKSCEYWLQTFKIIYLLALQTVINFFINWFGRKFMKVSSWVFEESSQMFVIFEVPNLTWFAYQATLRQPRSKRLKHTVSYSTIPQKKIIQISLKRSQTILRRTSPTPPTFKAKQCPWFAWSHQRSSEIPKTFHFQYETRFHLKAGKPFVETKNQINKNISRDFRHCVCCNKANHVPKWEENFFPLCIEMRRKKENMETVGNQNNFSVRKNISKLIVWEIVSIENNQNLIQI